MLSVTLAVYLTAVAEQATSALPLLPERFSLVRGVVVAGKEARSHLVSEVRVEHVYHGSGDAVGRTFSVNSINPDDEVRPSSLLYLIEPRLRVGDRGIWLVLAVRAVSHDLVTEDQYNYMAWPVLESGGPAWAPPYETIKAFAQAVQHVSQLPGRGEATAALKRLATNLNPYISSWAIARLPAVSQGAAEVSEFLESLVDNEGVPIQGQVELDRVLQGEAHLEGSFIARPNRDWQDSAARLHLLERWLEGAPSERDANLIVTRLDHLAQRPGKIGLRQADLARLVLLLVKNNRFPLSERRRAGRILAWAASQYESDEQTFDVAVKIVKSDLSEDVRRSVAGVFVREFNLNEMRRRVLTSLRDGEAAESVAGILEKALARPNGRPARAFVLPGGPKRSEPFSPPNAM